MVERGRDDVRRGPELDAEHQAVSRHAALTNTQPSSLPAKRGTFHKLKRCYKAFSHLNFVAFSREPLRTLQRRHWGHSDAQFKALGRIGRLQVKAGGLNGEKIIENPGHEESRRSS